MSGGLNTVAFWTGEPMSSKSQKDRSIGEARQQLRKNESVCVWLIVVAMGGVIGTPSDPEWNLIWVGNALIAIGFVGAILKVWIAIPCAIIGTVLSLLFVSGPTISNTAVLAASIGGLIGALSGVWLERIFGK